MFLFLKNFNFVIKVIARRLKQTENASFTSTFDVSNALCLHLQTKNIHIKLLKNLLKVKVPVILKVFKNILEALKTKWKNLHGINLKKHFSPA